MLDNSFDNFDFSKDFFEQQKDCDHEWEIIEFSVLNNAIDNRIPKKKICNKCYGVMTFDVPANSVHRIYSPPRINIPIMLNNTFPFNKF